MMKARINNIIPFSNVDGPGNRMAIFFQGCPFQCLYCHNPETINHCIHCQKCVPGCPTQALSVVDDKVVYNKELCVECDQCIRVCPHLADPRIKEYTVAELVAYIDQNKHFLTGITVSGGECMQHAEFLLPLFKEVQKMGLTCLIDSNGMYDFSEYSELLKVTDGVMLDIKAWDESFHQEITKGSNRIVKKNLDYLLSVDKLYEVRTVMLPHLYEENRETAMAVFDKIPKDMRYKLIEYRPFGVRDAGLDYFGSDPNLKNEIQSLKEEFMKQGYTNIITI